jgi:hypothetical protein
VHGNNYGGLEVRRIDGINWFSKAKGHYHIHAHAPIGKEQVCALSCSALSLKGGAQCFGLVDTQTLSFLDRSLREGAIQHILAILGLGICKEAKAGAVLIEAPVQPRFLIPTVLVVVDVVVGLRIGEMELHTSAWSATRRYQSVGTGPQYLVWSDANNIAWWHSACQRALRDGQSTNQAISP